MANPIERAARAIRSRLAGLVGEQQQLQQALAALEGLLRSERGKAAQPPARKTGRRRPALRASTSASTPPRRRRRPSRADQFLALVAERPGITVAEAAERLNTSRQTLYNASARLQREGQGRTLTPVIARATPPAVRAAIALASSGPDRPHERPAVVKLDVLDDRSLKPEQPPPYASPAHAATVPSCGS